jgi:hypothetical protein
VVEASLGADRMCDAIASAADTFLRLLRRLSSSRRTKSSVCTNNVLAIETDRL